ncbi:hypothetical protein EDM53_03565 [Rickettsiales endosymbiont of Peranema trichophorum]|uniref:hypothetical protein n=1 Tax=Rickettsiales endosymbiont of Peranema trichophorum TaxID=2486577 RepID=UPI001023D553|nr:hypothetical protein [Rickettsiales endosymbiont of Peranema trichophorum]RZI46988.1 hypothetical protein EDM53_03565 [Rickettsiales endosymbiont of Peranema trichophorum]
MRKIVILLAIAVVIGITNFTLWFIHTRVIIDSTLAIKKHLITGGVLLKYSDIRFTNFAAWKVKAVIDEASVQIPNGCVHSIERIDIESSPLENIVKVELSNSVNTRCSGGGSVQQVTDFASPPVITISTFSSLSKFVNAIQNGELRHYVKEITVRVGGISSFNQMRERQLEYSIEGMNLWASNRIENGSSKIELDFSLSSLEYNPGYVSANEQDNRLHQKFIELGKVGLNTNVIFYEKFKNLKKDGELVDFFEYYIDVKDISASSKAFSGELTGYIGSKSARVLPVFDLVLSLKNYRDLLRYYAAIANLSIESLSNIFQQIKPISPEQVDTVASILKTLSTQERRGGDSESSIKSEQDNNIALRFLRDGKRTTISGKPLSLIFTQLQTVLLSNISAFAGAAR